MIAALLMLGLLASCIVAEERAQSQAKAFCERFPVGSSFEEAVKQALSTTYGHRSTDDRAYAMFIGIPPFSRHFCFIRGADGKVIEANYEHFD